MENKIEIPKDVTVEIEGKAVRVKGPRGELEKDFNNPKFNKHISIEKNDGIVIKSSDEKRLVKALVGTIHAVINNMILGVTIGFRYTMEIIYAHFPINISIKDNKVEVRNFLGEKGVRSAKIIGNTDVKVEKNNIILTGIDIEQIGQTASNIESACKLSKRDRRIFLDGVYLSGRFLQNGEEI